MGTVDRRPHYVLVSDFGSWGGAEKVLLHTARALMESEASVTAVLGTDGALSAKLREIGVPVCLSDIPSINSGSIALARWGQRSAKLIARLKPDTVVLNTLLSISFISPFVRAPRLVWHEHNIQSSALRRLFLNVLAARADLIVAVSQATASQYSAWWPRKLQVVRNGIHFPTLSRLSLTDEPVFRVLMPSVLRPWKGHRVAIEAIAEMRQAGVNAKITILGESTHHRERNYRQELERLVERLGLEGSVNFAGGVEAVETFYATSDAVVVPSIMPDPFPTVVLEALHAGVPVVASAIGGIPEQVINGVTGYLCQPGSARSFAHALTLVHQGQIGGRDDPRWSELVREFSYESYAKRIVSAIAAAPVTSGV